jgi:hypothetical protein
LALVHLAVLLLFAGGGLLWTLYTFRQRLVK